MSVNRDVRVFQRLRTEYWLSFSKPLRVEVKKCNIREKELFGWDVQQSGWTLKMSEIAFK